MPLSIAIITGEASGDRAGAQLCREIKARMPDAHVWGTGGQFMREAGAEVVIDSSRWGVIGVGAVLKLMPRILSARAHLHRELRKNPPDVLVPVDAGAFNIGFPLIEGLCPWVRRVLPRTKILYYFPPGSWRRTLKSSKLGPLTDAIATPFEWSAHELNRLGANAVWVGHPLLDLVKPEGTVRAFSEKYALNPDHPVVGLLPGSRTQEISEILPLMFRAAALIARRVPGAQFVLALAPTIDREAVVAQWERVRKETRERDWYEKEMREKDEAEARAEGGNSDSKPALPVAVPVGAGVAAPDVRARSQEWLSRAEETPAQKSQGAFPLVIVENAAYDLMAASDALLVTSGTATLEAAILKKPMVITYRLSPKSLVNWMEYWVVKNRLPEFIGMPNILAQKRICPELVQDAATPAALADAIIGLLLEPETMLAMRSDLEEAVALLGEPGGAAKTADMVLALAGTAARAEHL